MLSPSLALEQFSYACSAPAPRHRPKVSGAVVRDAAFEALVAEIRSVEGQEVSDPPMLFKLVVALGCVVIALGGALSLQLAGNLL